MAIAKTKGGFEEAEKKVEVEMTEIKKIEMPETGELDEVTTKVEVIDPFADLSKLRLDQSFAREIGVKKAITTIHVDKPGDQSWFRVHSDPNYRITAAIIELKDENREKFLLMPPVAAQLPGEYHMSTLHTCIDRQGNLRIWPVRLPTPDGRVNEWHRSAREHAEVAMAKWIRIKANMSLKAYERFEMTSPISDPEWPDLTFNEILRIAFRDRVISTLDHIVVKQLLGYA
jgi:hypothetical protein